MDSARRLAPHTSPNRGILIAPYNDRVLKTQGTAYNTNDFTLCFLCHSDAPFKPNGSNAATNFKEHQKHVSGIASEGGGGNSTDIDVAGAGRGNAICAECHYRLHSTKSAYQASNNNYKGLVNFAPNVKPKDGVQGNPLNWISTGTSRGSCTLLCHGENHDGESYSP